MDSTTLKQIQTNLRLLAIVAEHKAREQNVVDRKNTSELIKQCTDGTIQIINNKIEGLVATNRHLGAEVNRLKKSLEEQQTKKDILVASQLIEEDDRASASASASVAETDVSTISKDNHDNHDIIMMSQSQNVVEH